MIVDDISDLYSLLTDLNSNLADYDEKESFRDFNEVEVFDVWDLVNELRTYNRQFTTRSDRKVTSHQSNRQYQVNDRHIDLIAAEYKIVVMYGSKVIHNLELIESGESNAELNNRYVQLMDSIDAMRHHLLGLLNSYED